METQTNLVWKTQIDDLHISTVLDSGFINQFRFDSEIHVHSYHELFIGIDGAFWIEFQNGDRILMEPDSACLVPSGLYHHVRKKSDHARKLAVRFNYTRDFATHSAVSSYNICHSALQACSEPILSNGCTKLCGIVKELQAEMNANHFACDICIRTLLAQFYVHFLRIFCLRDISEKNRTASVPESDVQNIRQLEIENYLLLHYNEPITEQDLAQALNLSRRQLNRVLQEAYKKGFRQLLIETRLHRAAQLLAESDRAIEEIACFVGYSSLSGFYSAFHNVFGVSAGQYRREFRK